MGESLTHINLVNAIKEWISNHEEENNLCIYSDLPTSHYGGKPPSINGYYPDIYATVRGNKKIFIGEAKTANDIESRHSRQQFQAFLQYCIPHSNSELIIAVPWDFVNCARGLIQSLIRRNETKTVSVRILERLSY